MFGRMESSYKFAIDCEFDTQIKKVGEWNDDKRLYKFLDRYGCLNFSGDTSENTWSSSLNLHHKVFCLLHCRLDTGIFKKHKALNNYIICACINYVFAYVHKVCFDLKRKGQEMKEMKLSERDMAFMDCIVLPFNSWIARDSDGSLKLLLCEDRGGICIYTHEEEGGNTLFWATKNGGKTIGLNNELFKFIKFDKPQQGEDLEKMYCKQSARLEIEDEAEICWIQG